MLEIMSIDKTKQSHYNTDMFTCICYLQYLFIYLFPKLCLVIIKDWNH